MNSMLRVHQHRRILYLRTSPTSKMPVTCARNRSGSTLARHVSRVLVSCEIHRNHGNIWSLTITNMSRTKNLGISWEYHGK